MTERAHILIVDDDPNILALLTDLLSPFYAVSNRTNAADAIQQLDWEPSDLLIIDLNMPLLLGEEAIRMIRERPAGRSLPILVISGDSAPRERLLDSDVQAILEKPFFTEDLLRTVQDLLAEPRPKTENDASLQ